MYVCELPVEEIKITLELKFNVTQHKIVSDCSNQENHKDWPQREQVSWCESVVRLKVQESVEWEGRGVFFKEEGGKKM